MVKTCAKTQSIIEQVYLVKQEVNIAIKAPLYQDEQFSCRTGYHNSLLLAM